MFPFITTIGLGGAVFAMLRFSSFCRRLCRGQSMDDRELARCQAGLKRSLAALAALLVMALLSMVLSILLSL